MKYTIEQLRLSDSARFNRGNIPGSNFTPPEAISSDFGTHLLLWRHKYFAALFACYSIYVETSSLCSSREIFAISWARTKQLSLTESMQNVNTPCHIKLLDAREQAVEPSCCSKINGPIANEKSDRSILQLRWDYDSRDIIPTTPLIFLQDRQHNSITD